MATAEYGGGASGGDEPTAELVSSSSDEEYELHTEWNDNPQPMRSSKNGQRKRNRERSSKDTEPPAVTCTEVLECGHACLESPFNPSKPCRPCRQYVEFTRPSCGHKVFAYCGIGIPLHQRCQGICGKRRKCGHPCVQACGEHEQCERPFADRPTAFDSADCEYCAVYHKAKRGDIPMPQFFLDQENGITENDPLGYKFFERCKGMTREQAEQQREFFALQGIFQAADHPKFSGHGDCNF